MKKYACTAILTLILFSGSSSADRNEFCAGFIEGFKAERGNVSILPICPIEPVTPIGSSSYREGLKAGMAAAGR